MAFPHPPDILAKRSLDAPELARGAPEALERLFAWMLLSRTADNRILELFRQGLIKGTVTGGQGNEGLIVPLALLADKAIDVVSFTHRGLGGHLVWSGHLCDHLNQYFANAQSPTQAREGNIHHGDPKSRSLPMISHLGAMLGPVLGATDSQRRLGRQAIGLTFFGDGSSSTGDVHETLNLASLLSLPIVFVIENNQYAYSTPTREQYAQGVPLWKRAEGYGMEGFAIDATDAVAAAKALADAFHRVRTTSRPLLIEAHTLRLRGHAAYDTCDYMTPGQTEEFFAKDSLPRLRAALAAQVGEARVGAIEKDILSFVESCISHCLGIARPSPLRMTEEVFAPASAPLQWKAEPAVPANLTMAQAINAALRKVLSERTESIVLGQDIGAYGGAFKVTEGLLAEFGRPRVFNTPLAESGCTGYAIGLALNGHRPIEEFQFSDFATEAATQITQNAATMYFRSGAACPIVFRLPTGGGLTMGSFHSQELDSFLLAMPGIKALYPSSPQDAFNAVLAAYEDNNPVILFEHKALYRRGRQPVVWDPLYRSVWKPSRLREGSAATVVTYGDMVHVAVDACDYLAGEYDLHIDLFDLRCLSPLDLTSIGESLARTGRLAVIHEGRLSHGFGAEIVSTLCASHFSHLKAAPLRIGSLDIPVPFAPELEQAHRPGKDSVIERLTTWLT